MSQVSPRHSRPALINISHPPADRVIAMSFPSSGSAALYRNSIQEVGQFLDQKHPGHYRVYNLCCEPLLL